MCLLGVVGFVLGGLILGLQVAEDNLFDLARRVTRGAEGATAFAGWLAEAVEVPGRRVDVVDTVGAGDTFCAALLAGLTPAKDRDLAGLRPSDLAHALATACAAAELACTKPGAEPPTRSELDLFLSTPV